MIKYIAFYLPQFHPIPENDKFWGKGFTEWFNVVTGKPRFKNHYQPKLPGELGFYDLRLKIIQEQQVELAKKYGIYGFCFHFYWFNGKRLLELPIKQFVKNKKINFPFCLNWANENWTRRWDGKEHEILIKQKHSEKDTERFIKYVAKNYFQHPNYIRISGKPVLIIYRPMLFDDPLKHTSIIREWCAQNGIGEIFLIGTHAIEHFDPEKYGFNAALEFAPNTFPSQDITNVINTKRDFKGNILDYVSCLDLALKYPYNTPDFKKFRGICPAWDNEARRKGNGTTFKFSNPNYYSTWLSIITDYTIDKFSEDERFIFINAWNEWAEGAYLEPDRKYGRRYLEKTNSVRSFFINKRLKDLKILFISHDACLGGAQKVLINFLKFLKERTEIKFKIICLHGGELLREFENIAETIVIEGFLNNEDKIMVLINNLFNGKPDLIYGNTVVAGKIYQTLSKLGVPIISHIHELESSIDKYAKDYIDKVIEYTDYYIAVSKSVKENLVKNYKAKDKFIKIIYGSINKKEQDMLISSNKIHKSSMRKRLKLPLDKKIVLGCGIGMPFRKGADLFVETAYKISQISDGYFFCWVGDFPSNYYDSKYGSWEKYRTMIENSKYIKLTGVIKNVKDYYLASDIMFLSSREDPFPLVMLESAFYKLPIIAFENSGGAEEFISKDAGILIDYENIDEVVNSIFRLSRDQNLVNRTVEKAKNKVDKFYTTWRMSIQIISFLLNIVIENKNNS